MGVKVESSMPKDSFGREITYLRLSVGTACNFHCVYCNPQGKWDVKREVLSYEQLLHLTSLFHQIGIKDIRLTGGEPLLRPGLVSFVSELKKQGFSHLAITTNGVALDSLALPLKEAGLDTCNISVDATSRKLFSQISGNGDVALVIRGLESALASGLVVKINCVPLLESFQEQVDEVTALALAKDIPVRFIELMPIGNGANLMGVDFSRLKSYLASQFGEPVAVASKGMGPARYFRYGKLEVGYIEELSHPFCADCNRLRLLSDGELRSCLQQKKGIPLGLFLRQGLGDEQLLTSLLRAIKDKPQKHDLGNLSMRDIPLQGIGG